MLMRLTILLVAALGVFAVSDRAEAQTGTPTPSVSVTATPSPTATGTESPTPTPTITVTSTPTTTTTASPSPTPTTGAPADLALSVSTYPNPATSGGILTFSMLVTNLGGSVSTNTLVRIPTSGGLSLTSGTGACYPDPYYGSSNCPGSGTGACVVYNQSTGQYYNPTTGQIYSSYSQCIAGGSTTGTNCVLYNQSSGQYYNTVTGQVYASYSQCIAGGGTTGTNCVVYNQSTGQYYNTATGQIYSSYSQCIAAAGSGSSTCLAYGQAGQYYNPATGQVYNSYLDCVSGTASGTTTGASCTPYGIGGGVDCQVPALAAGASTQITVSFVVTVSGGTLFGIVQLDPDNKVSESNEMNNTSSYSIGVTPGQVVNPPASYGPPYYAQPTAVTYYPTPEPPPAYVPPPAPVVSQPAPQPTGSRWLRVLAATPAYSVTMDPLWTAAPGEWYYVVREEAGWALAIWEGDTADWTEWIQLDGRVESVLANRPIPQLPVWLIVQAPTPAYSVTMDLLWTALPGERYRLRLQQDGWALVIWEGDDADEQEWIQMDDRVLVTRG